MEECKLAMLQKEQSGANRKYFFIQLSFKTALSVHKLKIRRKMCRVRRMRRAKRGDEEEIVVFPASQSLGV